MTWFLIVILIILCLIIGFGLGVWWFIKGLERLFRGNQ